MCTQAAGACIECARGNLSTSVVSQLFVVDEFTMIEFGQLKAARMLRLRLRTVNFQTRRIWLSGRVSTFSQVISIALAVGARKYFCNRPASTSREATGRDVDRIEPNARAHP